MFFLQYLLPGKIADNMARCRHMCEAKVLGVQILDYRRFLWYSIDAFIRRQRN